MGSVFRKPVKDIAKSGVFGSAVSGAIGSAENQGRANELIEAAIQRQRQEFAARQPFRDLLQQRIGNQPQRQDLSTLFQTENPFSRPVQ